MASSKKVILLLIDPQKDFHEGGSLAVPGSTEDSKRIAKMLSTHKAKVEDIYITLDSHHRNHIAHAVFWQDKETNHPSPFQVITAAEIEKEIWFPRDPSLKDHCKYYSTMLEKKGRFKLTIWPEHCLIGTDGHGVQDDIQGALMDWVSVKFKTINYVMKGMNCLTEMYSAIAAEVPIASDRETEQNTDLLAELFTADRLIIGGQALSHCVQYTVRDIVEYYKTQSVNRLGTIYLLKDGCSPVTGYDVSGNDFVLDMRRDGVTITTCAEAFDGL